MLLDIPLEVAVVDVPSAEAEQRGAGPDILPVVVSIRDSELSGILASVAVAMASQRCLVVVMEVVAEMPMVSS